MRETHGSRKATDVIKEQTARSGTTNAESILMWFLVNYQWSLWTYAIYAGFLLLLLLRCCLVPHFFFSRFPYHDLITKPKLLMPNHKYGHKSRTYWEMHGIAKGEKSTVQIHSNWQLGPFYYGLDAFLKYGIKRASKQPTKKKPARTEQPNRSTLTHKKME